jgi:hypothetical protein
MPNHAKPLASVICSAEAGIASMLWGLLAAVEAKNGKN